MGYTIVFKTKIVKLNDGRIIHFDRSGCNNDTQGRDKRVFTAEVYQSEEKFVEYATAYTKHSKPYDGANFDMKIGSRYCNYYDYGMHLLRMLKRAEAENEFTKHDASFKILKSYVHQNKSNAFESGESVFYDTSKYNWYEFIDEIKSKHGEGDKIHYWFDTISTNDLNVLAENLMQGRPVECYIW